MFASLRCFRWLTFMAMGIVNTTLLNVPRVMAESIVPAPPSSPLPEREAFQPVDLKPVSPFWQFPKLTPVPGPSQLVQQFYAQTLTPQQLGEGDSGCFRSQSATIHRLTPQSVAVILTQIGSCDDSLTGQQTRVDFTAQGDRWQVDWVGQRNHCRGKFWAESGQLCP